MGVTVEVGDTALAKNNIVRWNEIPSDITSVGSAPSLVVLVRHFTELVLK